MVTSSACTASMMAFTQPSIKQHRNQASIIYYLAMRRLDQMWKTLAFVHNNFNSVGQSIVMYSIRIYAWLGHEQPTGRYGEQFTHEKLR